MAVTFNSVTIRCVRCHAEFTATPADGADMYRLAREKFNAHQCSREFEPEPDQLDYAEK